MSSNEKFVSEHQESPVSHPIREKLSRLRGRISARAIAKHRARTSAFKFLASLRACKRQEARAARQARNVMDACSQNTVSGTPTGTVRS